MMGSLKAKGTLTLAVLCCSLMSLMAQTRVLFIGNSYTYYNDMPLMIERLAEINGQPCEVVMSVQGGVSLKDHWEGKRGLQSKELVASGNFDVVVLQDQSLSPIDYPHRTVTYARKFTEWIRDNNGKVILYQTWSRKNNPASQKQLNNTFEKIIKSSGIRMAPVADAWHLAMKEYPELELYDWDGSHPAAIGSYLAALIIYHSIFDSLPIKGNQKTDFEKIADSEMKSCEQIVHQVTEGR